MKKTAVTIVGVVLLLAGAAVGGYVFSNRHRLAEPVIQPVAQVKTQPPSAATQTVQVFGVAAVKDGEELRSIDVEVEAGKDPMEAAVRQLVEQGSGPRLVNPIPKGTRLLQFKLKDGLAVVNLSREFCDNFTGGSSEETIMVQAILRTLGQFKEIKNVRLLVEGKAPELGHLDLSEPLGIHDLDSENGGEN